MVPQRVSLLTIGAYNLPGLRSFYQRLGWEETEISSDDYAVFKTAGVLLSLFPVAELAKDAGIEISKSIETYKPVTFAINVDQPSQHQSPIDPIDYPILFQFTPAVANRPHWLLDSLFLHPFGRQSAPLAT